jgi:hypothetical protein
MLAVTSEELGHAPTWVPVPGVDVMGALVRADTSETELERRIQAAALLAWSFTGGSGFSDDRRHVHPDVAEVIRASVVRSMANAALPLALDAPSFSAVPGSFSDWSLAETAVLDRLRGRRRRGSGAVLEAAASQLSRIPDAR